MKLCSLVLDEIFKQSFAVLWYLRDVLVCNVILTNSYVESNLAEEQSSKKRSSA